MQTKVSKEDNQLNNDMHDIKSSLQSLLMANELVMEAKSVKGDRARLLEKMMKEIKNIQHIVSKIESREINGGGKHES